MKAFCYLETTDRAK